MKTNTPTAAPKFRNANIVATPLDTVVKATQADTFDNYFVTADFKLVFGFLVKECKAGDNINVETIAGHLGYTILDGYRCHTFTAVIVDGVRTETHFIPIDLIKVRRFTIVREYKTTTWEIL